MTPRARHSTPPAGVLWISIPLALLLALFLTPAAGKAQGDENYSLFNRGSISYQRYCSNCHGTKALGDGQIAHLLKVQPANLTQLSANNGGEFPEDYVRQMIDGRKELGAHGMRDMPIWGEVFLAGAEGPEAEARVKAKIDELVAYLKGIQRQ